MKTAFMENSFKKFDHTEEDRDRFVAEEGNWARGGAFVFWFLFLSLERLL